MKKLFYSTIILFCLSALVSQVNAQELAKPQTKKEIKKSEPENVHPTKFEMRVMKESSDKHSSEKNENVKNTNPYNATQDSPDYQAKKTEWIKKNPEKYKSVSGNPNLVILTEEEFNTLSKEDQEKALADPANYLIIR